MTPPRIFEPEDRLAWRLHTAAGAKLSVIGQALGEPVERVQERIARYAAIVDRATT